MSGSALKSRAPNSLRHNVRHGPTHGCHPPPEDFEERIVDIDVSAEMQDALPRVRLLGHLPAGPARRSRRPQTGAAPHPLLDVRDGPAPRPGAREVLAGRRRGDGQVPPARRHRDLRRPGADGAAVLACGCPWSTATATSARSTTARPPCATPRPGWPRRRCSWWTSLDEDTVDFGPTTTTRSTQPAVLPSAFPNLLVNGTTGIAVGMATNMAPHNLVEVIGAARHLIDHPDATLDDLMKFVPGPDLPTGGTDRRPRGHPRRLRHRPRHVPHPGHRPDRDDHAAPQGHRRHRAALHRRPREGRREDQGAGARPRSCRASPTSRTSPTGTHGLRLVIEVKNGFNPEAVLEQLYRLTPMEELVRHQQRRPGRRPAAHAGPARVAAGLRRLPDRRRPPAYRVPPAQARGAAAPGRGPARRLARHRRGHPAHPLLATTPARPAPG